MFILSTIDYLKDVNCFCCYVLSGRDSRGVYDLNYIFNLMTVFVVIIVWKRLADENLMKPFARMYFICDIRFKVEYCCLSGFVLSVLFVFSWLIRLSMYKDG